MLDLPSVSGLDGIVAIQFSAGQDYWSQAHVDNDYFFTYLSAVSAEEKDHKEVMYYFCYPEYKLKIPIKSGEVLVFNPLKLHSCSNCRYNNSFIFSSYVSTKSVTTATIGKGMHNSA